MRTKELKVEQSREWEVELLELNRTRKMVSWRLQQVSLKRKEEVVHQN